MPFSYILLARRRTGRVAQPAQARERLQERLLHDVIHVVRIRAQPRRQSPRRPKAPLNQQPERASITGAGLPDQITVAGVHTSKCLSRVSRLPASARHTTARPRPPVLPETGRRPPRTASCPGGATSASQADRRAPNRRSGASSGSKSESRWVTELVGGLSASCADRRGQDGVGAHVVGCAELVAMAGDRRVRSCWSRRLPPSDQARFDAR